MQLNTFDLSILYSSLLHQETDEAVTPQAPYWSNIGLRNPQFSQHTISILGNKVFVIGGIEGNTPLNTVELYRHTSQMWSTASHLITARSSHTTSILSDGTLLIVGGKGSAGCLASTEIYNPKSNTWAEASPLNIPRYGHATCVLADGSVLVTGGYNEQGLIASTEHYIPLIQKWVITENLKNARAAHTVSVLNDGFILATGGYGKNGLLTSAELYNPAYGTWSTTQALNTARASHTANILSNGDVLVIAGFDGCSPNSAYHAEYSNEGITGTAELYNPSTRQWTTLNGLTLARAGHTTTTLADGSIVVFGGCADPALDFAEIYNPIQQIWHLHGVQQGTYSSLLIS